MSVNKVILIGNVGKDPDVRYLENNVCVANFTLATTERGYTTQSGIQIPDKTEWHNIVVWRGLAEIAEKYVRKGTQLYIEGKIRTSFMGRPKQDSSIHNRNLCRQYGVIGPTRRTIITEFCSGNVPVAKYSSPANTSYNSPIENSSDDDLPF